MDDIPEFYYVVKSKGSVYYVDEKTAAWIRTQYRDNEFAIEFIDLAGCECFIPKQHLTDVFSSNPDNREFERAFSKKLAEEGKPPVWEED